MKALSGLLSEVDFIYQTVNLPCQKNISQREATDWLGRSERTLLHMRQAGLLILIEGSCWIRKISQNPNSNVLYNLENCEEVLNVL